MMTLKLSWRALCFSTHGLWKQLLTCQQPSGCSLIPLLCLFTRGPYPYPTLWICLSQSLFHFSYCYTTYMYAIILHAASCLFSLQLSFLGIISLHCEAHLMVAVCTCLCSRCCWTAASYVQMGIQHTSMCMYSLFSRPHCLCIASRASTTTVSSEHTHTLHRVQSLLQ